MPSPTGAERAKATKLRTYVEAGRTLDVDDAEWLRTYEQERADVKASKGRSARKAHTVESTYRESSEEAAAEGEGLAAATAAQAAAMVREEGRREDSLAKIGMDALKEAGAFYKQMCAAMLAERAEDAKTHRRLLTAWTNAIVTNAKQTADAILDQADAAADAKEEEGETEKLVKLAAELAPVLGPMFGFKMSNGKSNGKGKSK